MSSRGALAAARRAVLALRDGGVACSAVTRAGPPLAPLAPRCAGLGWVGGCGVSAFHAASPAFEGNPLAGLSPAATRRKQVQNSLSYRAKQRGFLELDLLVGGWAEANLPSLSDEELAAFSVVLDAENPDLFKWLTAQAAPPAAMAANPAYVKLAAHVAAHLAAHARAATRSKAGKEWVRGWSDSGFPAPPTPAAGGSTSSVPSSGNQQ